MTFHVLGRTVSDETGATVARLSFGQVITVTRAGDGSIAGRLIKRGPDCYDAWTALHPAVPTPTDRCLTEGVPLEGAVTAVLIPAGAQSC